MLVFAVGITLRNMMMRIVMVKHMSPSLTDRVYMARKQDFALIACLIESFWRSAQHILGGVCCFPDEKLHGIQERNTNVRSGFIYPLGARPGIRTTRYELRLECVLSYFGTVLLYYFCDTEECSRGSSTPYRKVDVFSKTMLTVPRIQRSICPRICFFANIPLRWICREENMTPAAMIFE